MRSPEQRRVDFRSDADAMAWHLEQPEPGRFTWRAPTGHRYDLGPEPIGPIVAPTEPPGDPPEAELDWDPPPF